jgi:phosphoribosylamine---glycine ligase
MKVLVIGAGAREHALIWKLRESARVSAVYAVPGNAGIAAEAECLAGDLRQPAALAELAAYHSIDLTIVGPEAPLVAGIVEQFHWRHLPIVGPTRTAAQLEGSKAFAKDFMARNQIPTAQFTICDSAAAAQDIIAAGVYGYPVVIKADGLAAGKGVFIASDRAQADQAIQALMVDCRLGEAGTRVVIEEFLTGRELSYLVFSDGKDFAVMPPVQDYKRLLDNNLGPQTGGMGSYCATTLLDAPTEKEIITRIVAPTLAAMREEGMPFRGVLYVGLMLTDAGPQVLEYNVRWGDPEAAVILARLETDLLDISEAICQENLASLPIHWNPLPTVAVVIAAAGYPEKPVIGEVIQGLEAAMALRQVKVLHAGTARNNADFVTAAGRVLTIVAQQGSLAAAREQAYRAVECIDFPGKQYRRDIAEHPKLIK